jgi:hypothetical protein
LLRLVNTLLAFATLLCCSSAVAVTVAIVQPADRSPELMEALGRLRGELTSVGFSTELIDVPRTAEAAPAGNVRPWLERLAKRRDLDAVVAILGASRADTVEVWIVDQVTGKSVVRTFQIGPHDPHTPEVLAVRAMELLRSSLLEIELTGAEPDGHTHKRPPATVVRYLESEREKLHPRRFALELGGLATAALDGIGPALLPTMRFDWAPQSPLLVHVEVAGLGTRPTISNDRGNAELTHSHGLLGASYDFGATWPVQPRLSLSAGVLHTTVVGQTHDPVYQGHSVQGFSFLLDAGVGARVQANDHLFLSLGIHAQMAHPAPAVRFDEEVVTTWARPNVGVDVTLGSWL